MCPCMCKCMFDHNRPGRNQFMPKETHSHFLRVFISHWHDHSHILFACDCHNYYPFPFDFFPFSFVLFSFHILHSMTSISKWFIIIVFTSSAKCPSELLWMRHANDVLNVDSKQLQKKQTETPLSRHEIGICQWRQSSRHSKVNWQLATSTNENRSK